MKSLFILLVFLICLGMGSKAPNHQTQRPQDSSQPAVVLPEIQVTAPSNHFLTVGKCSNCTPSQWTFVQEAVKKTNETVASKCFQEKLASLPLIQTNGLTPTQVSTSLPLSGIKVDVEMYYTLKRVLGYTLQGVDKIWVNKKYMSAWGSCELGSLLAHESSHKAGYTHDFKATARRPNSVPYSVNTAFKFCCK